MKESEPMLETRLYRCGWIFLFILCVLEIAKKVLFPHFVLSFGTHPCVFYTLTGYFCPGCGGTRSLRALLSGKIFVCAVDFPMIFYAAVVIGMKYRETWVYASLVIVVIHFVVKNLFYIKTGVEPFL